MYNYNLNITIVIYSCSYIIITYNTISTYYYSTVLEHTVEEKVASGEQSGEQGLTAVRTPHHVIIMTIYLKFVKYFNLFELEYLPACTVKRVRQFKIEQPTENRSQMLITICFEYNK